MPKIQKTPPNHSVASSLQISPTFNKNEQIEKSNCNCIISRHKYKRKRIRHLQKYHHKLALSGHCQKARQFSANFHLHGYYFGGQFYRKNCWNVGQIDNDQAGQVQVQGKKLKHVKRRNQNRDNKTKKITMDLLQHLSKQIVQNIKQLQKKQKSLDKLLQRYQFLQNPYPYPNPNPHNENNLYNVLQVQHGYDQNMELGCSLDSTSKLEMKNKSKSKIHSKSKYSQKRKKNKAMLMLSKIFNFVEGQHLEKISILSQAQAVINEVIYQYGVAIYNQKNSNKKIQYIQDCNTPNPNMQNININYTKQQAQEQCIKRCNIKSKQTQRNNEQKQNLNKKYQKQQIKLLKLQSLINRHAFYPKLITLMQQDTEKYKMSWHQNPDPNQNPYYQTKMQILSYNEQYPINIDLNLDLGHPFIITQHIASVLPNYTTQQEHYINYVVRKIFGSGNQGYRQGDGQGQRERSGQIQRSRQGQEQISMPIQRQRYEKHVENREYSQIGRSQLDCPIALDSLQFMDDQKDYQHSSIFCQNSNSNSVHYNNTFQHKTNKYQNNSKNCSFFESNDDEHNIKMQK